MGLDHIRRSTEFNFYVWLEPEGESEAVEVWADSSEEAAVRFKEQFELPDPPLKVCVRDPRTPDDLVSRFLIEVCQSYKATRQLPPVTAQEPATDLS